MKGKRVDRGGHRRINAKNEGRERRKKNKTQHSKHDRKEKGSIKTNKKENKG